MTQDTLHSYLDELGTALEVRDAPNATVQEVLRQVESHVHDSGEGPYEAFGDPNEYAKNFTPKARAVSFWVLIAVSVVLTFGGGWLLVNGLINLVCERAMAGGFDPRYGITVGVLAIGAWVVLLARRARFSNRSEP